MQAEIQKLFYESENKKRGLHQSHKVQSRFISSPLKKSNDSLYKILQETPIQTKPTQNNKSDQQFNQSKQHRSQQQAQITKPNFLKNLNNNFDSLQGFSKVDKKNEVSFTGNKQFRQGAKPSTPTYHAQSSLNFLKNRKKQILQNQANGLTLNNLQQIIKGRSKSKQNKSLRDSSSKQSIRSTSFSQLKQKNKLFEIKSSKKNQRALSNNLRTKSISELQKVQAVIGNYNIKRGQSRGSILQRSQLPGANIKKRSQGRGRILQRSQLPGADIKKCHSLDVSLRSSTSSANSKSYNSQANSLSKSRAQMLHSITNKIAQSQLLNTVQTKRGTSSIQESVIEKQNKSQQLSKRISHLQKILNEVESQKLRSSQMSQSRTDSRVISKLEEEVKLLKEQCKLMSKISSIKKVQQSIKTDNKVLFCQKTQLPDKNVYSKISLLTDENTKQNLNLKLQASHLKQGQTLINQQQHYKINPFINQVKAPIMHQPKIMKSQYQSSVNNPFKINFNYNNQKGTNPYLQRPLTTFDNVKFHRRQNCVSNFDYGKLNNYHQYPYENNNKDTMKYQDQEYKTGKLSHDFNRNTQPNHINSLPTTQYNVLFQHIPSSNPNYPFSYHTRQVKQFGSAKIPTTQQIFGTRSNSLYKKIPQNQKYSLLKQNFINYSGNKNIFNA